MPSVKPSSNIPYIPKELRNKILANRTKSVFSISNNYIELPAFLKKAIKIKKWMLPTKKINESSTLIHKRYFLTDLIQRFSDDRFNEELGGMYGSYNNFKNTYKNETVNNRLNMLYNDMKFNANDNGRWNQFNSYNNFI